MATFSYGHFNIFPTEPDWEAINNGAIFALNKDPHELFAAMHSAGPQSHVVQVNHPRSTAMGYFTYLGLDTETLELEKRQVFVSCGPFVRFEVVDGHGLGDTTAVDENGQVTFSVQVQAPTWMDVDEARLLENGEVVQTLTPDPAGDGVIRVDTVVTVEPSADAWYAVEVSGSGSLAPVAFDGTPYAVTNAIEVDVDGDGIWTPPKG